ncbi:hypothetical protein T265_13690, partial [Opisthorchis viverrini]
MMKSSAETSMAMYGDMQQSVQYAVHAWRPAIPNNRTSHRLDECVTCRTQTKRRYALIGQNASQSRSSTFNSTHPAPSQ